MADLKKDENSGKLGRSSKKDKPNNSKKGKTVLSESPAENVEDVSNNGVGSVEKLNKELQAPPSSHQGIFKSFLKDHERQKKESVGNALKDSSDSPIVEAGRGEDVKSSVPKEDGALAYESSHVPLARQPEDNFLKSDLKQVGVLQGQPLIQESFEAQGQAAQEMLKQWNISVAEASQGSFLDPLLSCLCYFVAIHGRSMSYEALISGIPIEKNGHISPTVFSRIAERAGFHAKLLKRDYLQITELTLPVVLLLKNGTACVVLGNIQKEKVSLFLPESQGGFSAVRREALQADYTGYAFYIRPVYQYVGRVEKALQKETSWFFGTLKQFKRIYLEVGLASFFVNILGLSGSLYVMNIYDRVLPNNAMSTLLVLSIGYFLALLFDFIFKMLRTVLVDTVGRKVDVIVGAALFEKMLNMRMSQRPPTTGALMSQLREFDSVREFFTSTLLISLMDCFFIVLFIALLWSIAGFMALIPLAIVPIILGIGWMIQIPLKKVVEESQLNVSQKHSILVESLTNLDTIKVLSMEGQMQKSWEHFLSQSAKVNEKVHFISALGVNCASFLQQCTALLIIGLGSLLVASGDITPGILMASSLLGMRIVAPLVGLSTTLTRYHQARESLKNLDDFMAKDSETDPSRQYINGKITEGTLEFRDVSFQYPGGKMKALEGIHFKIQKGEKVGFIGRSGCGKTTLLHLMLKLYDVSSGNILLDDVDIQQYHVGDIRRSIALLSQEVELFFGTVKENIMMGNPQADPALFFQACEISGVLEFLKLKPEGLDYPVGEFGRRLSKGQRQSVGLARALLNASPILMLDEATSSLDLSAEKKIIQHLKKLVEINHCTLLLTTHRPNVLELVDRVICLEQGKILFDGPRDEVLKKLQRK